MVTISVIRIYQTNWNYIHKKEENVNMLIANRTKIAYEGNILNIRLSLNNYV